MSGLAEHEKTESVRMKAIWALLIVILGLSTLMYTMAKGAVTEAQEAKLGLSSVSGRIDVLNNKVDNLNTSVNDIKEYFKIVPKDSRQAITNEK